MARRIDATLARSLPPTSLTPSVLPRAMRYAVLGPGKRIRPVLAVLSFETLGGRSRGIWQAAAAIEMIHAFSLVHDDLPCMDDDDLRRGRPTAHRKFGEAMALLAGDALLTSAFELVGRAGQPREHRARESSLLVLAGSAGVRGMIRGQALDMLAEGRRARLRQVEEIHRHKTGDLIGASTRIGAVWAGASNVAVRRMERLGLALGAAFQARDDLLNATSDAKSLGKAARSDAARGKATLPAALGLRGAQRRLGEYCDAARRITRTLPARRELWEDLVGFLERRTS